MTTKANRIVPIHVQAEIERAAIEAARPTIWGNGYRAGYEAGLKDAERAIGQHDKEGREWVIESLRGSITRECASRIQALSRENT